MRPSALRFVVLASSTVLLARSAQAQTDQRGRLEGTVVDSVHTRPLAGVRVDSAVVSDKALKLPAGTYVVQVGKRKFAKVTLS